MKTERLFLTASLAVASSILALAVVPSFGDGLNSGNGKHLIAYFVLSLLLGIHFLRRSRGASLLLAAMTAGTYGAIIELIQILVPYRQASLIDAVVNYAGALLALIPLGIIRVVRYSRFP